jgi:hypothetical protein
MLSPRLLGRTGLSVAPLALAGRPDVAPDGVVRAFHQLGVNYFFVTPRMKGLSSSTSSGYRRTGT